MELLFQPWVSARAGEAAARCEVKGAQLNCKAKRCISEGRVDILRGFVYFHFTIFLLQKPQYIYIYRFLVFMSRQNDVNGHP